MSACPRNRANLDLQNPGAAHRPFHKTFGLAVILEPPALRVPLQGTIQTRHYLSQQANRHRAAPDLDIADGTLATTNAVQKVLSMITSHYVYTKTPTVGQVVIFFNYDVFMRSFRARFNLNFTFLSRHNTRACHDSGDRAGHRAKPDAPRHRVPDA